MAALSAIRTDIRNITGATDTAIISDATVTDLINKAQTVLADDANLFPAYGTRNSVASTRVYTFLSGGNWTKVREGTTTSSTNLSDTIRIYRVDYDGDRSTRINVDQIYDLASDDSEMQIMTNKAYYIDQTQLGIFTIPNEVKEIKIYYYSLPTALSGDSDVPEIDTRYTESLIYYGCWKVAERLRDMNLINYFKMEFLEWRTKIIDDGEKRFGEDSFNVAYNDF